MRDKVKFYITEYNCLQKPDSAANLLSIQYVFIPGLKMVVHNIPSIPIEWNVVEYHKLIAVAVRCDCIPSLQK